MKKFRYIDGAAILRLDEARCVGCGMCETVCPHRIFTLAGNKARIVDYNGCMECGACARNCPTGAIFVNPDDGCGRTAEGHRTHEIECHLEGLCDIRCRAVGDDPLGEAHGAHID